MNREGVSLVVVCYTCLKGKRKKEVVRSACKVKCSIQGDVKRARELTPRPRDSDSDSDLPVPVPEPPPLLALPGLVVQQLPHSPPALGSAHR